MGDPINREDVIAALRGMNDVDRAVAYAEANARRSEDARDDLRAEFAKHLGDDRADAYTANVRADAFLTDGTVDVAKVKQHVSALFGTVTPATQYGQASGPVGGPQPGDTGRAEAAKRFGGEFTPSPIGQPAAQRGAAGAAAAAKRFGTTTNKGNK